MEIRLEIKYHYGTPDDEAFVSYATIPVMEPPPEIVLWGERMFVKSDESRGLPDGRLCPVYREGIMWRVSDPTPRRNPAAPPATGA